LSSISKGGNSKSSNISQKIKQPQAQPEEVVKPVTEVKSVPKEKVQQVVARVD
jgi:hypothetical protein